MRLVRPGWARVLLAALAAVTALTLPEAATAAAPGTGGVSAPETGTLRIARRVVIRPDGQVEETRELVATGLLSRLWREEAGAIRRVERFGWRLEAAEANGAYTLRLHRRFADAEEFNREHAGSIQVVRHLLYDEIEFRDELGILDKGMLQRMLPQPLGVDSVEWVEAVTRSVRLEREVTLPGRVTRSSAGTVDGRTVRWSAVLGELGPGPVSLVAGGRSYRRLPVLLLGGAVVFIVGGTVAVVLTRRWWDTEA